jgi:hypothetical protein
MSHKFKSTIGLVNLSSDPVSGTEGEMYFNTTLHGARIYQNGAWSDAGSGTSTTNAILNIDGGFPTSNYGGIDIIDGGGI